MADTKSHEMTPEEFEIFLNSPAPTDPSMLMVWKGANLGRKRDAERKAQQQSLSADSNETDDSNHVEPGFNLSVQRSLPLEARLRTAASEIGTFGNNDVFSSYPLKVSNQFPTTLTRIPIFRPSRRVTQQKIQDTDNTVPFETPYGVGRRHGPPLTVTDEDTLIVLLRMRDRGMTGPSTHLPENVRDFHQPRNGMSTIHRVTCTIKQINERLGKNDGGGSYRSTLASLKRLNACKIEFDRNTRDGGKEGGAFDLVKIQWRVYDDHGLIDAVFPPVMADWLQSSYTYIDWDTRKKLTPLGKAIHRYYSGQRSDFTIGLKKLAVTVGYDGRVDRLKPSFEKALNELVELGWFKSQEITGNGRTEPFMVHTTRQENH